MAAIRFVTSLALKGIEFVTKKRSERVVIESGTTHGRERLDLEMENVKKVFKIFSNSIFCCNNKVKYFFLRKGKNFTIRVITAIASTISLIVLMKIIKNEF